MEWSEGVRGVWRSETKREMEEQEREWWWVGWGGVEGSRWWGPGEHFIFLIDNNGLINEQSFHTPHTVHHGPEFCGRARKPEKEREREKEAMAAKKRFSWNSGHQSHFYCPILDAGFFFLHFFHQKLKSLFFRWSCVPAYFLTGQIVCHRALVPGLFWQRNKRLCCSLWTRETSRRGQAQQDMGHSRLTYTFYHYPD